MSTHCVIAKAEGDAWVKGSYVHQDGYPTWIGPTLVDLVTRDGVETVLRTLTEDRYGWSNLHPTELAAFEARLRPGDRFEVVEGYGLGYTLKEQPADLRVEFDNTANWGCNWSYALAPVGVAIGVTRYDTGAAEWYPVAFVKWADAASTDWAAVEASAYPVDA